MRLTRSFGCDNGLHTNRHEGIYGVISYLYFDGGGGQMTVCQDVYIHRSIHLKKVNFTVKLYFNKPGLTNKNKTKPIF